MHIFNPKLGPYSPDRAYTPADALLSDLYSSSQKITLDGRPSSFVFVQPSTYGTDNQVLKSTLATVRQEGCLSRGIAVIDLDSITDEELSQMHALGVRGVRLNLQSHGKHVNVPQLKLRLQATAARIQHLQGWKVQLFAPAHVWNGKLTANTTSAYTDYETDLYSTILSLPVPVIADHVGGLLGPSRLGVDGATTPILQAGFHSLITLAKMSRVVIKISGLYRCSSEDTTTYNDMASIIRTLAKEVPDSLIWGSDWPHTGEGKDRLKSKVVTEVEPFRKIDNVRILEHLHEWVGDEETWMKMMVHNPRRIFA